MKIKREIHQATSTNPESRGGLLPHHGDEVLDLGGVEISPWAAMEESSPPLVADSGLISVFLIYAPPPSRDASETFIYGGFRSWEPTWSFDGGLGGPGGPITWVARPRGVGAPPGGYPPSWLCLLRFKVSYRHILKNIDPRKIPDQFESV